MDGFRIEAVSKRRVVNELPLSQSVTCSGGSRGEMWPES